MGISEIKNFFLDVLFPKFCFNCNKEGSYLCQDCQGIVDILEYQYCLCQKPIRILEGGKCRKCRYKKLNGLYFAAPYQNFLIKKLIQHFKYHPYVKDISFSLASLIITHFQGLNKELSFSDFILIPAPLAKKKLRERGFNQAQELGRELAKFLKIPMISNVLIKVKSTLPQVALSGLEREKNIKNAFLCRNKDQIKGKKILLIDDVYTTGNTMEELAKALKTAGAKEVWGVVAARANPGEDKSTTF